MDLILSCVRAAGDTAALAVVLHVPQCVFPFCRPELQACQMEVLVVSERLQDAALAL